MARSDRYTPRAVVPTHYSDPTESFDLDPVTGSLAVLTNEDAIRASVLRLLLTNRYERFQSPWIGSKLRAALGETMSTVTETIIADSIRETIANCEPRVKVNDVRVVSDPNNNAYLVTLDVEALRVVRPFQISITLRRTR